MLLTRLAFWLALPSPLTRCLGAIVPKLFLSSCKNRNEQLGFIVGLQPSMPSALCIVEAFSALHRRPPYVSSVQVRV